jgi:hypothetical protein
MSKKVDYDKMEVKVVFKQGHTFEEQLKIVEKVNNAFVDIAVKYEIDKWKAKKN